MRGLLPICFLLGWSKVIGFQLIVSQKSSLSVLFQLGSAKNDNNDDNLSSLIAGLGAPAKRLKVTSPAITGDYDKAVVGAEVENLIQTAGVVVFSSSTCPFCDTVKEIFESKKVSYKVVELDERPDLRAEMASLIGGRASVPAVFIAGDFVGGCNDGGKGGIVPLNNSGELDILLSRAGLT
eukprot:CAMPEP_0178905930 /NCGR_PEP_ID=MMETSP0786-20121207/6549_1 /TAXON_ID=186022 /ORGANISM="Thalassionema frauenfeldii, Strain CCMP 1798" /LENGTH=180 /DNA_ID=CAMNT_0020577593 /DNA_START=266 /DNA_END=808 /DNA_ORIENTATION=+